MFKIALTNLSDYNNGDLNYEWVSLPASDDDLDGAFARLNIDDSTEYFITDYENDFSFRVEEYSQIDELNELAARLEELNESDRLIVKALSNYGWGDLSEILDIIDDCRIYYDCYTMADVAYEVINECGYLDQIPENLQSYFDYDAFGRDLAFESTFIYAGGGVYVEVCR